MDYLKAALIIIAIALPIIGALLLIAARILSNMADAARNDGE